MYVKAKTWLAVRRGKAVSTLLTTAIFRSAAFHAAAVPSERQLAGCYSHRPENIQTPPAARGPSDRPVGPLGSPYSAPPLLSALPPGSHVGPLIGMPSSPGTVHSRGQTDSVTAMLQASPSPWLLGRINHFLGGSSDVQWQVKANTAPGPAERTA